MTPKIARFLAQHQPATPCLVLDVDRVEANFSALRKALPLARIYYAVKANPARQVLERLVGLASHFDAASIEEVIACLDAGAQPDLRHQQVSVRHDWAEPGWERHYSTVGMESIARPRMCRPSTNPVTAPWCSSPSIATS